MNDTKITTSSENREAATNYAAAITDFEEYADRYYACKQALLRAGFTREEHWEPVNEMIYDYAQHGVGHPTKIVAEMIQVNGMD